MGKLSYIHNSISELSKSIRKQLKTSHDIEIKQTEMLNVLSQSAGFQNYQSFKAKNERGISKERHLIELSFTPHNVNEVFERDSDGVIQDRRHTETAKVLATIPVKIKTAQHEAFFKSTVWINSNDLPERNKKTPEYFLSNAAIDYFKSPKGTSFLSKLNMCSISDVCVSGNINKQTHVNDENQYDEVSFTLSVSTDVFQHLNIQIDKVTQANTDFEYAIEQLEDLAFHIPLDDISPTEKSQIFSWLSFIEQAINIVSESGGLSLYSWNHEKFPTIKKVMTKIANNQTPEYDDLEYAKRNLHVMSASDIWVNEPPTIQGF